MKRPFTLGRSSAFSDLLTYVFSIVISTSSTISVSRHDYILVLPLRISADHFLVVFNFLIELLLGGLLSERRRSTKQSRNY